MTDRLEIFRAGRAAPLASSPLAGEADPLAPSPLAGEGQGGGAEAPASRPLATPTRCVSEGAGAETSSNGKTPQRASPSLTLRVGVAGRRCPPPCRPPTPALPREGGGGNRCEAWRARRDTLSRLYAGLALSLPLLLLLDQPAQAQSSDFLRSSSTFLQAFRQVVEPVSSSVVRIQCDGRDTCLGSIIAADGWVLTKAHDLSGKMTCLLSDGRELPAERVALREAEDVALLRINAKGLKPLSFSDSRSCRAGAWIATVGHKPDPLAVGIVSVATRRVIEAWLGATLDTSAGGLAVVAVVQRSPAHAAGLRPRDVILTADGQSFSEPEQFQQHLGSYRPGETITLKVRRAQEVLDVRPRLQNREAGAGARAEFQNRLGSELSSRRGGYATILQHDGVVRPSDCGGPIVDLNGRVIGINISRAGRVETWALPGEVVTPLIAQMRP